MFCKIDYPVPVLYEWICLSMNYRNMELKEFPGFLYYPGDYNILKFDLHQLTLKLLYPNFQSDLIFCQMLLINTYIPEDI